MTSPAAKLATYSAGMAYLNTKDYNNAILYLDQFSADDVLLSALSKGAIGDAFAQLDQKEEAFDYYVTAAQIKTAYEALNDTNEFTDAEKSKLGTVEQAATADQSDAEIRTAVEAASDSNVFTDADHTKLNAIEASADVTDTTNVVAALTAGSNITIAADGTIASSGGGGGSAITIQEEGSSLSTAAETINFVGAGVTASGTGTTKTITVSGSAGAELASGAIVGTNLVLTKSDSTTVSIDASTLINPVGMVSGSNQWYISYGTNADDPVNVSTMTSTVWSLSLIHISEPTRPY